MEFETADIESMESNIIERITFFAMRSSEVDGTKEQRSKLRERA